MDYVTAIVLAILVNLFDSHALAILICLVERVDTRPIEGKSIFVVFLLSPELFKILLEAFNQLLCDALLATLTIDRQN